MSDLHSGESGGAVGCLMGAGATGSACAELVGHCLTLVTGFYWIYGVVSITQDQQCNELGHLWLAG